MTESEKAETYRAFPNGIPKNFVAFPDSIPVTVARLRKTVGGAPEAKAGSIKKRKDNSSITIQDYGGPHWILC